MISGPWTTSAAPPSTFCVRSSLLSVFSVRFNVSVEPAAAAASSGLSSSSSCVPLSSVEVVLPPGPGWSSSPLQVKPHTHTGTWRKSRRKQQPDFIKGSDWCTHIYFSVQVQKSRFWQKIAARQAYNAFFMLFSKASPTITQNKHPSIEPRGGHLDLERSSAVVLCKVSLSQTSTGGTKQEEEPGDGWRWAKPHGIVAQSIWYLATMV